MAGINTKSLRWLGVLVPLFFWIIWLLVKTTMWDQPFSPPAAAIELLLISVGSTIFSNWIAVSLERGEAEVRRRSEHLEALRNAGLALTTELELSVVLQRVVDLSRGLVDARYGALGVLDENGDQIDQFFTSGMQDDECVQAGPPQGHGLLGMLTYEGKPLRVADIEQHPRAAGFPPGHPHMRTLLGVPIRSKGRIFGNLYVADKRVLLPSGGAVTNAFTQEDQDILEMFATQAAVAIENAQLYRENQQLAVLRERDRIGMDLHDGVIQSIYAIGLLLDDASHRLQKEPEVVRSTIQSAIGGLNDVIKDIRSYIQDLRPQRFEGRDVRQGLDCLAQELRTDTYYNVILDVDSQAAAVCTARQADEFLHIAQEALTNVRKHAEATTVRIGFQFNEGLLQMMIQDDGAGMENTQPRNSKGNGLRNMRERARALHGEFRIATQRGNGTAIIVTAPIEKRDA